MKNFFSLNRIKFDELAQDTLSFIRQKYEDAGDKFTAASPWGQIVQVILSVSQLMFYYVEDSITELNIFSASRPQSVYGLARLAGHNPMRSISATGTLTLAYNGKLLDGRGGQIIIPNYTKVKCIKNGLTYVISLPQDEVRIPIRSNASMVVKIIQGSLDTQTFTGTGGPLQSFEVNMLQGNLADHYFVNVYVNGEKYTTYDSFYDIPRGVKGCLVKTGINTGIDIYFGNEYVGFMPPFGSEIRVEYLISGGESGNLRNTSDIVFEFVDTGFDQFGEDLDLNQYIDIDVDSAIAFGTNAEPTFLTRIIAPKTSRAMVLANPENYVMFMEKFNYFSVVDAFTTFDDDYIDDDNIIYLFLIPNIRNRIISSENYFTVPQDQFVLSDSEKNRLIDLIHDSGQMIVTTIVKVLDPIIRRYVLSISLATFEGHSKDAIQSEIQSKLSEYFLTLRRRDRIPKSDIIAIVENVDGVDSVNVHFISEQNEIAQINSVNGPADTVGLDEFGDIVIGRGELPIIRGGWSDRNGISYDDTIDTTGKQVPCSLNIEFKKIVQKNFNSTMNRIQVNQIRSK